MSAKIGRVMHTGEWWKDLNNGFPGNWTWGSGCKHTALEKADRRSECRECWMQNFVAGPLKVVHNGDPHAAAAPSHQIIGHANRLLIPLASARRDKPTVWTNICTEPTDHSITWLSDVFGVMSQTPQHRHVLLTKEPKKLVEFIRLLGHGFNNGHIHKVKYNHVEMDHWRVSHWPLKNLIIMASAGTQALLNEHEPHLAYLAWKGWNVGLHLEPVVEPVVIPQGLFAFLNGNDGQFHTRDSPGVESIGGKWVFPLKWVVIGGETGLNARPMHPAWADNIIEQCHGPKVPVWFKGHGEWVPEILVPDPARLKPKTALYMEEDGSTRPAARGARGQAVTVSRAGKRHTGRKLQVNKGIYLRAHSAIPAMLQRTRHGGFHE
jgi:protein gp37